jgi:hypothetical protein
MSKHKKTEPLPKSLHEAVSQPARSPQMRIKRKERQRRKKEIGTGKFRAQNLMNGKNPLLRRHIDAAAQSAARKGKSAP